MPFLIDKHIAEADTRFLHALQSVQEGKSLAHSNIVDRNMANISQLVSGNALLAHDAHIAEMDADVQRYTSPEYTLRGDAVKRLHGFLAALLIPLLREAISQGEVGVKKIAVERVYNWYRDKKPVLIEWKIASSNLQRPSTYTSRSTKTKAKTITGSVDGKEDDRGTSLYSSKITFSAQPSAIPGSFAAGDSPSLARKPGLRFDLQQQSDELKQKTEIARRISHYASLDLAQTPCGKAAALPSAEPPVVNLFDADTAYPPHSDPAVVGPSRLAARPSTYSAASRAAADPVLSASYRDTQFAAKLVTKSSANQDFHVAATARAAPNPEPSPLVHHSRAAGSAREELLATQANQVREAYAVAAGLPSVPNPLSVRRPDDPAFTAALGRTSAIWTEQRANAAQADLDKRIREDSLSLWAQNSARLDAELNRRAESVAVAAQSGLRCFDDRSAPLPEGHRGRPANSHNTLPHPIESLSPYDHIGTARSGDFRIAAPREAPEGHSMLLDPKGFTTSNAGAMVARGSAPQGRAITAGPRTVVAPSALDHLGIARSLDQPQEKKKKAKKATRQEAPPPVDPELLPRIFPVVPTPFATPSQSRMEELQSIAKVKDKFASRGIMVHTTTLSQAMVSPQDKPLAACALDLPPPDLGVVSDYRKPARKQSKSRKGARPQTVPNRRS